MSAPALAVLVVDDHPLFRLGLVGAWRRERPQDSIDEAATVHGAVMMLQSRSYDLAVVDVVLPDGIGLDVCQAAARVPPTLPVVLTTHDAPAIVHAAKRCGAAGFFAKDVDVRGFLTDVTRLAAGQLRRRFPDVPELPPLTMQEQRVLAAMLTGATNPEIAEHLHVSIETAKTHVSAVLHKLDVHDRFSATAAARAWGYDIALPYLGDVER